MGCTCAVLMAAYNGLDYIRPQVDTILGQKNISIHLYISVDLSDDATYDWCADLEEENDNITVLSYGEKFGGAAPNFFRLFREVDFNNFDYVALSDQDDIWHEEKISQAVGSIALNGTHAYSGNVIAFWENGRTQLIDKAQPQRKLDYLFEAAGPGCTYVITRKLAIHFQRFLDDTPDASSMILHDWLLYAFARSQGYQWFIDPIPYMNYRQHKDNQLGVNQSLKSFIKRARYILFDGGLYQIKLLLSVLPKSKYIQKYCMFSRKSVFNLLLNCGQLRRKPIERVYVFFILLIILVSGNFA